MQAVSVLKFENTLVANKTQKKKSWLQVKANVKKTFQFQRVPQKQNEAKLVVQASCKNQGSSLKKTLVREPKLRISPTDSSFQTNKCKNILKQNLLLINRNQSSRNKNKKILINVKEKQVNCSEILQDFQAQPSKKLFKFKIQKPSSLDYQKDFFDNDFKQETLMFLIKEEQAYHPYPQYLDHSQANLKWEMRAILVDWMTQVCSDHLFKRETLFYSVNFLDRFLSKEKNVKKEQIQLVGVTAILLAAKMDEIYTPKIEYIQAATKNIYSVQEILQMENYMYKTLQYKITPPTINLWANWYMSQWDKFIQ